MLVFGFLGESGEMNAMLAWGIGVVAWAYIVYEVWVGDAKKASEKASEGTQLAFTYMTYILTFGWAIYPLGYLYGEGVFGNEDLDMLNIVYNIADVVNKTAFGMMIWYAATVDTAAAAESED